MRRPICTRAFGLLVILFSVVIAADAADAQVAFDVKTKLAEKPRLAVAKSGVISYIRQSTWARVQETRETHALWLKNYVRTNDGTRSTITLDVEVRTPRAIGEGALIAQRQVTVAYDTARGAHLVRQDQLTAVADMNSDRQVQALALVLGATAAKAMFDDSRKGTLARQAVLYAGQDLQRQPTLGETLECLAVGAAVMQVLDQMRQAGQL